MSTTREKKKKSKSNINQLKKIQNLLILNESSSSTSEDEFLKLIFKSQGISNTKSLLEEQEDFEIEENQKEITKKKSPSPRKTPSPRNTPPLSSTKNAPQIMSRKSNPASLRRTTKPESIKSDDNSPINSPINSPTKKLIRKTMKKKSPRKTPRLDTSPRVSSTPREEKSIEKESEATNAKRSYRRSTSLSKEIGTMMKQEQKVAIPTSSDNSPKNKKAISPLQNDLLRSRLLSTDNKKKSLFFSQTVSLNTTPKLSRTPLIQLKMDDPKRILHILSIIENEKKMIKALDQIIKVKKKKKKRFGVIFNLFFSIFNFNF